MNHASMLVAEHLKLNVPRMLQKTFRINIRRAKGLLRFAAGSFIRGKQFLLLPHNAHAAAPAARDRFQNEWISDLGSFFGELLFAFNRALTAWNRRQARRLHFPPRAILLAHHFNNFWPRPDEGDFARFTHFGKVRILRKEAVSRMDGIHICNFRGADDLRNIQITFAAAGGPDAHGFISKSYVERIPVGLGIDRNRTDSQFLASANHAQGDFPAIGYQNLVKHRIWTCLLFAARPDAEQGLPVLHGLAVVCEDAQHFAGDVGFDFVHQLHGLNDAQGLPVLNVPTNLHKWLCARTRRIIEGAHDRRFYEMEIFG